MLRTRLWMGALLILLAVGLLVLDDYVSWHPALLVTSLLALELACYELLSLLPEPRPRASWCYAAVALLIFVNWPAHVWNAGDPWRWILGMLTGSLMVLFLVEAALFREPGGVVVRLSLGFWLLGYLGLFGCFFIQLRWLPSGAAALALAIFVPKCGDIGAYFTGRAIGKHRMTPILSPKKTWEGAAGGLTASVLTALIINAVAAVPPLPGWVSAVGFGAVVGIAGMLGDLMESLIKRDCGKKDASQVVPGFGGVLDVLDAILFSAPVSYWWLAAQPLAA